MLPEPVAVSSPMPESLLRADDVLSDSSTDGGVNGLSAADELSTSYPEKKKEKKSTNLKIETSFETGTFSPTSHLLL